VLKQHSTSLLLWQRYLTFRVGHFPSFRIASVTDAHAGALRALVPVPVPPGQPLPTLDAVHRAVVCLWNAGFTEKAVAVCQALLEFNCHYPRRLASSSAATKVTEFRSYWDAQTPRIGEAVRTRSATG